MRHFQNRRLWKCLLAVLLVPLGVIAFWPSPVDRPIQDQLAEILQVLHRHKIPFWFDYRFVEASANIAMFIPLGYASALASAKKAWWQIGTYGLVISCCIELGQLLFLHNRFASSIDLVTNTSGAVIGSLLAAPLVRKLDVRRLSAADL